MLPWYPPHRRQYAASLGAADHETIMLKKSVAKNTTFIYIGAVVFFVVTFLAVITLVVYLTYPRSNGVHKLNVMRGDFKCPAGPWITDTTVGTFGKCYLIEQAVVTVGAARADCRQFDPNAHLVSIKTAEEQKAIEGHIEALELEPVGVCEFGFWTSGYGPTASSDHVWHDGSRVSATYTNWQEIGVVLPPKKLPIPSPNDECIFLASENYIQDPTNGIPWGKYPCDNSVLACFICEL